MTSPVVEIQDGPILLRYRNDPHRGPVPTPRHHWLEERYGELRGGYYTWDESLPLDEVLQRWMEHGAKAYDDGFELPTGSPFQALYPAADLWPHRRDDRPVNPVLLEGLKAHGWLEPVVLRIGANGCIEVAEGNHRVRIAHDLGLKHVPVRLWFVQEAPCPSDDERIRRKESYVSREQSVAERIASHQERGLEFNPRRQGGIPNVERIFDECFDVIEQRFPDFGEMELHQDDKAGSDNGAGSERQFAYCKDGKPIVIAFASKAVDLPDGNVRGLMRHEMGHALEFRYGVAELTERLGRKLPKTVERRADVIAECVWGEPVRYDARDVQCIGMKGKSKRPSYLPDDTDVLKPNGSASGYGFLLSCPGGPEWFINWVTDEDVPGYDETVDWDDVEADLEDDEVFEAFMEEWDPHPEADSHVTYYRTRSPTGVPLIVIQHSGIEHVWAQGYLDMDQEEAEAQRGGFWYLA